MSKPDELSGRDFLLTCAGLWSLAVAKPILDVLGPQPAYWSANRIEYGSICALVAILTVCPPLVLAGPYYALKSIQIAASRLYAATILTVFSGIAIYHAASLSFGKPLTLIFLSFCAGMVLAFQYFRRPVPRRIFVFYCGAMALLTPIAFLLYGPTRDLAQAPDAAIGESAVPIPVVRSPVVVLLFDELNTAALVDDSGNIRANLFPNFDRLGKISTWYQNATTNYGTTDRAVPSILTGKFQSSGHAATTYEQNPENLFTLLSAPDGVLSFEPLTTLCPPELCGQSKRAFADVLRSVVADSWLIERNTLVPDKYASLVPPIPQRFTDLASINSDPQIGNGSHNAIETVSEWLAASGHGRLAFIHLSLPHAPYLMNASGKPYSLLGSYELLGWKSAGHLWDAHAPYYAVQGFQRYVLQAMYADRVLGNLMEALEDNGLLAESTIVVSSDHGVAFTPGQQRRAWALEESLIAEVNAVPLFWKSANQATGERLTKNVESIDIVPTLVAELGGDASSWGFDGQPMTVGVERPHKIFEGEQYRRDVWPSVVEASRRLYSQITVVPQDGGPAFLRPSKYESLVGSSVAEAKATQHTVNLKNPAIFMDLATFGEDQAYTPNFIEGWLEPESSFGAVGIAINGVIVDTVDTLADESGRLLFSSVFDPSILRIGANELQLVGLTSARLGANEMYFLNSNQAQFRLQDGRPINGNGDALKSDPQRLVAGVDTLSCSNSTMLHIKGWIGDRTTWTVPPVYLVSYYGHEQVSQAALFRSGMAASIDGLAYSGYDEFLQIAGKDCDPDQFKMYVFFDHGTYAEMENVLGMQGGE